MSQLRHSSWADRFLLQEEMRRLESGGYSFKGETEEQRLGADAWVLQVGVVEDNGKRKPRWLQKLEQKRNAIDMFLEKRRGK